MWNRRQTIRVDARRLLSIEHALDEEKTTDEKLSDLGESINIAAAEGCQYEEESGLAPLSIPYDRVIERRAVCPGRVRPKSRDFSRARVVLCMKRLCGSVRERRFKTDRSRSAKHGAGFRIESHIEVAIHF